MADIRSATSPDGTTIGYRVVGGGPAVVMVHGVATDSGDWFFLAPLLSEHFTVVSIDRRGRGESGDGPTYAMEREAEDILTVMAAVGAELLVGHSYGGLCSMKAAAQSDRLKALFVYEPPISVSQDLAVLARDAVAAGDDEELLTTVLSAVGMTDQQFAAVRNSGAWGGLLAAMPTVPRELESAAAWTPLPPAAITARSLYLLGGDTTDALYTQGLESTLDAFASVTMTRMPGQLHVAHVFDAHGFADLVTGFFLE
jgi:pimeloyl-ACP methyl ester carboxylesterase